MIQISYHHLSQFLSLSFFFFFFPSKAIIWNFKECREGKKRRRKKGKKRVKQPFWFFLPFGRSTCLATKTTTIRKDNNKKQKTKSETTILIFLSPFRRSTLKSRTTMTTIWRLDFQEKRRWRSTLQTFYCCHVLFKKKRKRKRNNHQHKLIVCCNQTKQRKEKKKNKKRWNKKRFQNLFLDVERKKPPWGWMGLIFFSNVWKNKTFIFSCAESSIILVSSDLIKSDLST